MPYYVLVLNAGVPNNMYNANDWEHACDIIRSICRKSDPSFNFDYWNDSIADDGYAEFGLNSVQIVAAEDYIE